MVVHAVPGVDGIVGGVIGRSGPILDQCLGLAEVGSRGSHKAREAKVLIADRALDLVVPLGPGVEEGIAEVAVAEACLEAPGRQPVVLRTRRHPAFLGEAPAEQGPEEGGNVPGRIEREGVGADIVLPHCGVDLDLAGHRIAGSHGGAQLEEDGYAVQVVQEGGIGSGTSLRVGVDFVALDALDAENARVKGKEESAPELWVAGDAAAIGEDLGSLVSRINETVGDGHLSAHDILGQGPGDVGVIAESQARALGAQSRHDRDDQDQERRESPHTSSPGNRTLGPRRLA